MEKPVENNISAPNPFSEPKESSYSSNQEKPKIKFSIVDKFKEIMSSIKEKTGIDGIYVIIFLGICVFFVYLGIFGSLITSLVGTLYPGFSTIKAIQKNKNKKEWLTYWVVFGTFLIFDMFSNIIMKIIPFYFVLKILFLIWMFIPGSNGCKLVYEFLITKVMTPIEQIFDMFFKEAKEMNKEFMKKAKKGGVKIINNLMNFKKKMQQKEGNAEEKNMNDDDFVSKSVIPSGGSALLAQEEKEKKAKKLQEEKEKEEHINLNKTIEEYRKTLNQNSQEEKKEGENNELELSFEEEK